MAEVADTLCWAFIISLSFVQA